MFCEVYLLDLPYHLDRPFDYFTESSDIKVGSIVRVPFGRANRLRFGVVSAIKDAPTMTGGEDINIKPVHSVTHEMFSLSEEMLGLCLFMKEHTLCTFGEAFKAILPPGALSDTLNVRVRKTCKLNLSREAAVTLLLAEGRAGIRSDGQRAVIRYLLDIGSADAELVRLQPGVTSAHIRALAEKGIITVTEDEDIRNPYAQYAKNVDRSEIVLSPAQEKAFDTIESLYIEPTARAALLFGITGSGKTKVIMKAIDRTVAEGKRVIMLVPEISLTPQTVSIFCSRYGERVAVIHSSLSQGERLDAYRRIRRGDVDLVIGTRSAIFAPLDNIGMIVIDEEHEHTYKSEQDPKYHARDIAAYRCAKHGALMLLASATPSLESFYKAKSGIYTLVPLRERYGGVRLPEAIIVDMREELRLGNTSPLSKRLHDSLLGVKERDEQAIIFLNRRGYSSQISCKECGEVITCPRCSVSLTYHSGARGGKLLCHLCGYTAPVPKTCECGSDQLSFLGYGTQKLEGELEKYLPDMPVMRMDADTTQGKLAYDRMLEDFRGGNADILLGTQMVAKGHDFPRVTLVGVALADTSLYVSDFRAAERTFSLLTQVIGRAGRASDGGVAVIQTFSPQNEIIRLACKQDYESFYEGEIALRRELSYPPFCDMAQMTLTASDEVTLMKASKKLSDSILEKLRGEYGRLPFVVFGPFEAQVYKLNEKYRMRMVIKCKLNAASRRLYKELLSEFALERDVTLAIDLNPLSV
ncbi:MAG: primosomal protein N' [Clostridia bacterium]|nr:primosomal protein N' [Clostridia bacterium]